MNPKFDEFKTELERLRKKKKMWTPPKTLDEFLEAVKLMIETSKYTDTYRRMPMNELKTIVKLKTNRVLTFADVEEAIDGSAYLFLIFDKLVRK